ncbi:hypothetical protein MFERI13461_00534 [Mycoplasma feriruminatoris]|uniref:hypothetical protein n=1 Tax=Mycoplasma feriruminatoris TaxID=1179777 RepID=UPI00241DF89B|nr:hypothetical protein [Mycoplasma feriruminatoris]WFQ91099.1 hypothetical protein MFERI13461_00534 [Mycoplasma feriruminatoris]
MSKVSVIYGEEEILLEPKLVPWAFLELHKCSLRVFSGTDSWLIKLSLFDGWLELLSKLDEFSIELLFIFTDCYEVHSLVFGCLSKYSFILGSSNFF